MKKICFFTISFLAILSPIGLIIGLSQNKNNYFTIVGQGSSAISPIINAINRDTKYDVQYQTNGSGEGFNSQIYSSPKTPFGMTSSLKIPNEDQKNNWQKNKIKTLTWAIDAISIVINLPNDIIFPNNINPEIDITEMSKLYDLSTTTNTTWSKMILNLDKASGKKTSSNETPIALGRIGGKTSSGTADGFWHVLSQNMADGLVKDEDHSSIKPENLTPESNAQSLKILKSKPGSITYLSLGYALKNKTENVKLANLKAKNGSAWIPTIENVLNDSYKWRRAFNLLYSTENKSALEFANFLLENNTQNLIENEGFVKLSEEQKNKQKPLNVSDYENDSSLLGLNDKMGLNL